MKKWLWSVIAICSCVPVMAAQITVFAAASMTHVLQQIGADYEKAHPQDKLVFSFAGSSSLAKQIEQGAPADLFISADQAWMDYVAKKLPQETRQIRPLVENELVLIAPISYPIQAETLQAVDFKRELENSYLAIGDDHVPVGRYATQALQHLGVWAQVEHRLAKAKDVRAVLAYVERGELPLGIVYATDANISDRVAIVATFPRESYGRIVYPAALISDNAAALRFWDYLSSQPAAQRFKQAGFQVIK